MTVLSLGRIPTMAVLSLVIIPPMDVLSLVTIPPMAVLSLVTIPPIDVQAQSAIRTCLGTRTLQELLADREEVNKK